MYLVVDLNRLSMHEHFLIYATKKFHRHREQCRLAFYPARRFKFPQPNLNSWHPTGNPFAQARVAEEPEQGRSIDQQSLQLLLSAIYDNFIYRPLKTLGNFYIITKTIFVEPSTKIEQKYLIP
jgi:hypothetical protein